MKIKRKIRLLVGCLVAGAVLAYLLDPLAGRWRRKRAVAIARRRSEDLRDLVRTFGAARDAITNPSDDTQPVQDPPAVAGVTDVAPDNGDDDPTRGDEDTDDPADRSRHGSDPVGATAHDHQLTESEPASVR